MTAPEHEYDYSHIEQKIAVTERYTIKFTFYDHPMCGPLMYHVYLEDMISHAHCSLRCDCPCEDGRPSLLQHEIIHIMIYAMRNRENTLNLYQMIACLNIIYPMSASDISHIEEKLNLIITRNLQCVWGPLIIPNNSRKFPYYKVSTLDEIFPYAMADECPSKHDEPIVYYHHKEYNYLITDDPCFCDIQSNRSSKSLWNDSEKKLFGKFIDHITHQI